MKRRRARRSRGQWREICAAYAASGMTAAAYAAQHDLNPSTLAWWKSELHRSGDRVATPQSRDHFVEVVGEPVDREVDRRCTVTIRLGQAELFIEGLPSAAWLHELIATC